MFDQKIYTEDTPYSNTTTYRLTQIKKVGPKNGHHWSLLTDEVQKATIHTNHVRDSKVL
jgi:hypothetical protein